MPTIIVCLDPDCPTNHGADATCPCCGRLAVVVICTPTPGAGHAGEAIARQRRLSIAGGRP